VPKPRLQVRWEGKLMASVVEIQVQVNPTDSAAKIDGVSKELNTLGNAGAQAGQRAGAGMQQMTGHAAVGLASGALGLVTGMAGRMGARDYYNKSITGWLRGGGARMISKEQNNLAGQYAGDGVIG
jgi:hypothetical protein